jgi:hypothetical protein
MDALIQAFGLVFDPFVLAVIAGLGILWLHLGSSIALPQYAFLGGAVLAGGFRPYWRGVLEDNPPRWRAAGGGGVLGGYSLGTPAVLPLG